MVWECQQIDRIGTVWLGIVRQIQDELKIYAELPEEEILQVCPWDWVAAPAPAAIPIAARRAIRAGFGPLSARVDVPSAAIPRSSQPAEAEMDRRPWVVLADRAQAEAHRRLRRHAPRAGAPSQHARHCRSAAQPLPR